MKPYSRQYKLCWNPYYSPHSSGCTVLRRLRRSLNLDVVVDHDLAPVLDFLQHELLILLRGLVDHDIHEDLGQLFFHRGTFHDLNDIGVDAPEHRLRYGSRREQAVPGVGSDAGEARFRSGRHVRQFGAPLERRNGQRLDPAGEDVRKRGRHVDEHELHLVADDSRNHLPGAARAANSSAILPEAPARLSTMKECPQSSFNLDCTWRAVMSVAPPGAYGTIMRTGLVGNFSAGCAADQPAANVARDTSSSCAMP